ncbi:solute carrier family 13 (sodium-dependent dicarboxylate transporter), member 2/3/5 [Geoalkalibacter ferrihydriticus]|uniref:Anion transporter n=2 Tax=Geoalkalibacter ferrihydriticus TaxID=392333 RepID=A0A0C2HXY5_9BACT|nr:DASS family sodium-coupled anion symporter [Geoalkalibacter ferrihydriticus]KIH77602.1 anion transporter [Geoalkalibacter ferrihydriticus DSM 17813]SDL69880.1 solute carrier family 13 (sodium-dependent dicarboxylate transporter), member 2/3/5 [Geoalkalibacter ferrihydriticus]
MLTALWRQMWVMHDETKRLFVFTPAAARRELKRKYLDFSKGRQERDVDLADEMEEAPAEHINRLSSGPDGIEEGEPREYSRRQMLGLFLGPILFALMLLLPAPAGMEPAAQKMAAIALLMATWWMCESIPIPATSLLPIALFPWMGIMATGKATAPYANHLIFLFMGGFIIALSMQRWNLHRRIAMNIVKVMGFSPSRLILGFMVATAALSAFVSNTATTVMMMPIGLAIIAHVVAEGKKEGLDKEIDFSPDKFAFGLNLMLGIAYAASIGGIATLIGTPPNTVLAGYLNKTYGYEITFAKWMSVGVPLVLVMLPLCWLWLTRVANPLKLKKVPGGKDLISNELRKMGKMNTGERWTSLVFGLTAFAWIFQKQISVIFPEPKFITDATIAMIGALVLFLIPINLRKNQFVMDWHWASKMPWGVLILFGGGLALADGFKDTKLAEWIGGQVSLLENAPILILIIAVATLIIFLTELTSNTATAAMVMPILSAVAIGLGQNPLLLVVPAAVAASCAFMLPVATPPNAIVFGSGYVTIPQMARSGFGLNIIGIMLTVVLTYLLVIPAFDVVIGELPSWVNAVSP